MGTCTVEGCDKTGFALGLCWTHYQVSREAEKRAIEAEREGKLPTVPVKIGKNGKYTGEAGGYNGNNGRPSILVNDEVTLKRIRDLAGIQCTIEEAAGIFASLRRNFTRFHAKAS